MNDEEKKIRDKYLIEIQSLIQKSLPLKDSISMLKLIELNKINKKLDEIIAILKK